MFPPSTKTKRITSINTEDLDSTPTLTDISNQVPLPLSQAPTERRSHKIPPNHIAFTLQRHTSEEYDCDHFKDKRSVKQSVFKKDQHLSTKYRNDSQNLYLARMFSILQAQKMNLRNQSKLLESRQLYLDQESFQLQNELEKYRQILALAKGQNNSRQKTARFLFDEDICFDRETASNSASSS